MRLSRRRDEPGLRDPLIDALRLEAREVYDVDGLIDLADLGNVADAAGCRPELRYGPGRRYNLPRLQGEDAEPVDVFAAIRQGESSSTIPTIPSPPVERFIEQAVADPDVLAISRRFTGPATTRRWCRR